MTNNYEELGKYSFGALFNAAARKLFEKKAVRLTLCVAAAIASIMGMSTVYRYCYPTIWWLYDLLCLPAFTVWTASSAGFIANICGYGIRSYLWITVGLGVLSWLWKTAYDVLGHAWYPDMWTDFRSSIGIELLQTLPMMLAAVGIILLIGKVLTRRKKKA
ncbi:MAG: hypothetical protein K2N38_02980 [Oscillospiraceae bacterium]|nr:hypothetical protein [Oscillospiraceae bacterium]